MYRHRPMLPAMRARWYNSAPLGKIAVAIALVLCFLPFEGARAAKDCDAIRQKSGGAASQKCLYDNQEETLKQQIAAYKAIIDKNKVTVKASYEGRINEENYAWKDIDLRLGLEESDRQYRIDQLGSGKENAEQVQIEKNVLSKLKSLHKLTTVVHGNKLKRLKQNMDSEIADWDQALPTYELQLRQQDMPRL